MLIALLAGPALAAPVDRVPEDFASIQDAIDHGTAATIRVGPGEWDGAVVTRPVHLVGEGAIIDRGVKVKGPRAAFVLPAAATGTVIEGMIVDCASSKLDLGVYASATNVGSVADHVEITQNHFQSCVQAVTNSGSPEKSCSSDAVSGGALWTIHDNVVDGLATRTDKGGDGGGVGILLYNTTGADVYGNLFTGQVADDERFATSGVALAGCVDCTVSGNQFEVAGGRFWYSAVSNAGAKLDGAVASRNLLLTDNDAFDDSAPWLGVSFVSRGSVATDLADNVGVAYVDHEVCGDGELYTVE